MTSTLGRPFWTLWSAFTASNLGDGLSLVAMPLLAIRLTDDARLIATVTVFQYLPFLLIALPAGVLIDRFDRRWIAVIAQAVRAVVVGGLGLVLLTGETTIGVLFVVAFLIGTSEVMTDGGLPALVRTLVRSSQLEVANSRISATQTVTNAFIGPPVGAALFQFGTWIPFVASAAVSLVSVATLVGLPGRHRPAQDERRLPFVRRTVVGLGYVWRHDVLRPLVIAVATFSFVGAAGNAVSVILITERFGLGGVGYGLILSVDAVASVVMSFFVARLIARTSHSTSMRLAVVCFSAGGLLLGLFTAAVIAFVAAVVNGVSDPTWNIVSSTVRQRLVPDEVFGRMMTAYLFIAWGMRPVGAFLGGVVAEQVGVEWVPISAAIVVGSLLVTARPMFQRVDDAMARSLDGAD